MHADLILIILAALVILAVVYRGLAWVYLPPQNSLSRPEPEVSLGRNSGVAGADDDWADQLHEINQLGKFGDLTRPVAHLTHYEVEALIRQLAVPEWVPDRYRMAA